MPEHDGADADVVLGQPDFLSEGPAAGGTDVRRGLHLPTGVTVIDGRLVVCDAWHHRVLAWDGIPADELRGAHLGAGPGRSRLRRAEPRRRPGSGVPVLAVRLRGRRRGVLGRRHRQPPRAGLAGRRAARSGPPRGHPAGPGRRHHARGQPRRGHQRIVVPLAARHRRGRRDPVHRGRRRPSRPDVVAPSRWTASTPADGVLGQDDLVSMDEFKIRPQTAQRMRFPYAVVSRRRPAVRRRHVEQPRARVARHPPRTRRGLRPTPCWASPTWMPTGRTAGRR